MIGPNMGWNDSLAEKPANKVSEDRRERLGNAPR
jgi:hypothetical protein